MGSKLLSMAPWMHLPKQTPSCRNVIVAQIEQLHINTALATSDEQVSNLT